MKGSEDCYFDLEDYKRFFEKDCFESVVVLILKTIEADDQQQ